MGLAEIGNKAELDQLGLELWLNWSLEDFPRGVGGWGMGQNWKYSSAQLGPELGNSPISYGEGGGRKGGEHSFNCLLKLLMEGRPKRLFH